MISVMFKRYVGKIRNGLVNQRTKHKINYVIATLLLKRLAFYMLLNKLFGVLLPRLFYKPYDLNFGLSVCNKYVKRVEGLTKRTHN